MGNASSALTCIWDQALKPCLDPSISRCQAALGGKLSACLFLEGNWRTLDEENTALQTTEVKVKRSIKAEDNKGRDCDEDVAKWQEEAGELEKKFPAIRDDYTNITRCVCGCTPNLCARYRIGQAVYEQLRGVRKLETEAKAFASLAHERLPGAVEDQGKPWTVGLSQTVANLRGILREEDRRIIGIYGKGGVGKSTLLRELNHMLMSEFQQKPEEALEFRVVIFVPVSNMEGLTPEKITDIQEKISDRLGRPWDPNESHAERARQLLAALRKKKKFVIILDDVWKWFDVESLGIPRPDEENHGKLVISSRSFEVCIDMDAHSSTFKVEGLKESAAWELFLATLSDRAISAIKTDQVIEDHARAIARQCRGLPLALKVIGKAVAGLRSREDWSYARTALEISPSGLSGVEEGLLKKLKYSYDMLEPYLQPCFLYCALFPYDCSISKDHLVEYWISEGFMAEFGDLELARTRGHYIIHKLASACLLEDGDTETDVKMHDIIRDEALWIASDCGERKRSAFVVHAGIATSKAAPDVEDWKDAERISLMSSNIDRLPDSPDCLRLNTLLLLHNPRLQKLHDHFFNFMLRLRVLDLSHTSIRELPISSGALAMLQHLNLCRTRIVELPKNLGNLKELRNLNLNETFCLARIPNGVLDGLSKLRVLNFYMSNYGKWKVQGDNQSSHGISVEELERLRELKALGITIHKEVVLERFQQPDVLTKSTRQLSLKFCEGLKSFHLSNFQHMVHLKEISLHSCYELKELIIVKCGDDDDIMQQEFNLEVLNLTMLMNFERVMGGVTPNLLQNLQELSIESCPKLESINWILQLSKLQKLSVCDCAGILHLVDNIPEEQKTGLLKPFSKLRSIVLKDLKKLESICPPMTFLSLESIRVQGCLNLSRLPFGAQYYEKTKLPEISGYQEWWKALKWEEKGLEAILRLNFVAI
ncbi:hypothetical protein J5N97_001270 [Dioscorea zingiberensis]|uniref:AAA+ ATPase domain-containing protein n=1 Tax=Dioscorea zingiberensis TaxID=325984 RepID=A0A9D5BUG1_9LILI|nr:hypothetical protein J5N97_001270 [Dioscorea zingiberensis]